MPTLNLIQISFLIASYFFAAIPFGYLVGKIVSGKDVRAQGSGNIGATNVSRMLGKKWGLAVLFLDGLKGYMVVELSKHVGSTEYCNIVACIAILAHCYPIYLKFKGGKGVATALGVLGALSWTLFAFSIGAFALCFYISRRISVGSLGATLSVVIGATLWGGHFLVWTSWFFALLIWWKHKPNIQRLITGQEPRYF